MKLEMKQEIVTLQMTIDSLNSKVDKLHGELSALQLMNSDLTQLLNKKQDQYEKILLEKTSLK